jgi:hypothetical protein
MVWEGLSFWPLLFQKKAKLLALAQRLEIHHQGQADIEAVDERVAQLAIPWEGGHRADGDRR